MYYPQLENILHVTVSSTVYIIIIINIILHPNTPRLYFRLKLLLRGKYSLHRSYLVASGSMFCRDLRFGWRGNATGLGSGSHDSMTRGWECTCWFGNVTGCGGGCRCVETKRLVSVQ